MLMDLLFYLLLLKFHLYHLKLLKMMDHYDSKMVFSDFDLFKNVYRRVTKVNHNFLLIDNNAKDENLKIRQNFNELIKI